MEYWVKCQVFNSRPSFLWSLIVGTDICGHKFCSYYCHFIWWQNEVLTCPNDLNYGYKKGGPVRYILNILFQSVWNILEALTESWLDWSHDASVFSLFPATLIAPKAIFYVSNCNNCCRDGCYMIVNGSGALLDNLSGPLWKSLRPSVLEHCSN